MQDAIARVIRYVVISPPVVLLACATLIVVGALVGLQPLWASSNLSLAAVAHAGDTAGVYRMLQRGADPNRAGDVFMSSTTVSLLPIEAAVESRQVETVQVLLNGGVHLADADRRRLLCLARASTAPEVEAFFGSTVHDPAPLDCAGLSLPPH